MKVAPTHQKSGFTLVELLVVISIIALLIAILLPSLQKAREQAKLVQCLSNQRGLGQASAIFANAHDNRLQLISNKLGQERADSAKSKYEYNDSGEIMAWTTAYADSAGATLGENWDWGIRSTSYDNALNQAQEIKDTFPNATCPSDKIGLSTPFYPEGDQMIGVDNNGVSPAAGMRYWGRLSIGLNEDICGAEVQENELPAVTRRAIHPNRPGYIYYKGEVSPDAADRLQGNMDRVFAPSSVLLFMDMGAKNEELMSNVGTGDGAVCNLVVSAKNDDDTLVGFLKNSEWRNRVSLDRHKEGRLNVVFADMHGATVKPVEWTDLGGNMGQRPTELNTEVRISPYGVLKN